MPNASGKIDGTTATSAKAQQVHQVAVLERAGEQHVEPLRALPRAPGGRARSRRSRRARRPRAARRSAPARPCSRSACRSRRRWAGRPRGTPRAARRCPRRAGARWRCPGWAGRCGPRPAGRRAPRAATAGSHSSMSTPGGTACTRSTGPQTSSTTPRMCSEPTIIAAARRERARAPADSSGVAAHRVLELGSVHDHRVPVARSRADRAAEDHVAGDDQVRRGLVRADRRGVGLDPRVELRAARVLHLLHPVALVAVDHEHRQQPADVGRDGGRSAEVVPLGVRILREHRHVVPRDHPLPRQLAGEDVRAGAASR